MVKNQKLSLYKQSRRGQNPNIYKCYKCTTQTYILKCVRCSELLKSINSACDFSHLISSIYACVCTSQNGGPAHGNEGVPEPRIGVYLSCKGIENSFYGGQV